jgi:anaerobic magnesium-protoporphyrin IX monomethyl ester cyclase
MKVTLIQPSSENQSLKAPPLGLAYLASVLKKKDIDTKIIDLNVENIQLNSFLSKEKPDIIGISSIFTNARQGFKIAKQVKTMLPKTFVVMGGAYPSTMKERLLIRHKEVDAVVVGEGEQCFLNLVNLLNSRKKFSSIAGLLYREENKIKTNLPTNLIQPVDKIPFPAREELKMELYAENAGTIFTSRGCPQQCIFCSRPVFGRKWRGHSPNYVLKEIEQLVKEYKVTILSILDDNFSVNRNRTAKILDGIIAKRWNLEIYFWNGLRADHMTKTLATKLKKAGCTTINFGVESVDTKVISFIKKGVNLDQIEHAINLTWQAGIKVNLLLMIGNPKDTSVTAAKIIDFVKKMDVDGVHLSMATPIFGTVFWDWVKKNGHWLEFDKEEMLDWPIDDVGGVKPVFETADFTAEERIKSYNKIRSFLKDNNLLI